MYTEYSLRPGWWERKRERGREREIQSRMEPDSDERERILVVFCVARTHHLMVIESTYTIASRLPHLLVHVCIQSTPSGQAGGGGC